MNTYPKLQKPFMFWLAQQLLPADDNRTNARPMNDREFYSTMAMIVFALIVLSIAFHTIV